ncbi:MAG: hypothetical protein KKF33_14130 [Alphaproteobacteria bacterium]|nr:hypothetical protein [Alphaproteobacteria bacterium]
MILGAILTAALCAGIYGLIKCLSIKPELEDALGSANIKGYEFYSSVVLQFILYKNPESKGMSLEAGQIVRAYIRAAVTSIISLSCFVIVLAVA